MFTTTSNVNSEAVKSSQTSSAAFQGLESHDRRHSKHSGHQEHKLTDQTNLLPTRKVILTFFGLSLGVLVSTLDSVIVATALSTIGHAFKAGAVVSWVPSAYMLTSTR